MNAPLDLVQQGTDEWHQARLGRVTASRLADVLAKVKSGEAAIRANYRAELIAERLTGVPAQSFTNAAMEWGTEHEPYARGLYEVTKDVLVDQVGFAVHPTIEQAGASPDGCVGDDGLVEIKCPQTATHIATLLSGVAPSKYIPQMQWQMACTGRKWCDFCSYDPRLSDKLKLFVVRVERDDEKIAEMETEVRKFLAEIEDTINKLEALCQA